MPYCLNTQIGDTEGIYSLVLRDVSFGAAIKTIWLIIKSGKSNIFRAFLKSSVLNYHQFKHFNKNKINCSLVADT